MPLVDYSTPEWATPPESAVAAGIVYPSPPSDPGVRKYIEEFFGDGCIAVVWFHEEVVERPDRLTGHLRYGGRIKGTPNRCTAAVASKLEEIFASFDPLMKMRLIAEAKDTPLDVRVGILKELAQYLYPKKRAIEVDTTLKESVTPIISGA